MMRAFVLLVFFAICFLYMLLALAFLMPNWV